MFMFTQKMIDLSMLLSRLDEHESRINNLEIEVVQLKKTNLDLEETNKKLVLDSDNVIDIDVTRRDVVPRSCFEVKAMNPNAQSGEYFIDPDGQIGGDEPFKVYCDMTTSNI